MKPITIALSLAVGIAVGMLVHDGCHSSTSPTQAPAAAPRSPLIDQASTPWPHLKTVSSTPSPAKPTVTSRKPSRLAGIFDAFRHVAHIHRPNLPKIDATAPHVATAPPGLPAVVSTPPAGVPIAVVAHSALPASPPSTPAAQPPQSAVKDSSTVQPLHFGVAHTTRGETAVTFDILHRDVAVNPLGIRIKVGEWGAGVFVAKRIGKGSGFDAGPQVNYQAGRSFVGVGYEVRNRTPIAMFGEKF